MRLYDTAGADEIEQCGHPLPFLNTFIAFPRRELQLGSSSLYRNRLATCWNHATKGGGR